MEEESSTASTTESGSRPGGPVPSTNGAAPFSRRRFDLPEDPDELHLLVTELEDERSSGRMREALWISVIVHLVLFIFLMFAPKMFPHWGERVALVNPSQELKDNSTFLELPPDAQRILQRPKTNILSDKNRIAQSTNPTPERQTLEELERMRRQGRPGAQASRPAPRTQPQTAQQQQPTPQQQQQPPQQVAQAQPNPQLPQQTAPQQKPNPFAQYGSRSAGSQIEDAVRAAASGRGQGDGGDFGAGIGPHRGQRAAYDILSDTQGVDFGPYMARVIAAVRQNWYAIIPEEAMPPLNKTGRVAIEFAILKNGSIGGIRLAQPDGTSGDTALDRAAWGGITGSSPFPPLPSAYKNDRLELRFFFFYLGPDGKLH